jgi:FkbM family methyltransferase
MQPNVFEKTNSHPIVSLIEEKIASPNYVQAEKEILLRLPKNFDFNSIAIFYTPGEDYLEWVDVVEAVSSAKGRFVMFELGAGYGRWCVNAMKALKVLNPIPSHFVAVEAEASHFGFLKSYFSAHGLNLREHRLIKAAIDICKGSTLFHMGDPNGWYGQCIDQEKLTWLKKLIFRILKLKFWSRSKNPRHREVVKSITLNSLLELYDQVDLIDMDIQGQELPVLQDSIDLLNLKVKRLHIGTHSHEIDQGLERLFTQHGWRNIHLYPAFAETETAYGLVHFNDGVQSWVNPRII